MRSQLLFVLTFPLWVVGEVGYARGCVEGTFRELPIGKDAPKEEVHWEPAMPRNIPLSMPRVLWSVSMWITWLVPRLQS